MYGSTKDKDINEVFEDILLTEEKIIEKSYEDGFSIGSSQGNPEGYHLGFHRGAELGAELGFYAAIIHSYLKDLRSQSENIDKNVKTLEDLIDNFPHTNVDNVDILDQMNIIRGKYKKVCAQLKIPIKYSESDQFSF